MSPPPIRTGPDDTLCVIGIAMPDRQGLFDLTVRAGRVAGIVPSACRGPADWIVMPALTNFHAHADRAFTASAARPASLADAVARANAERGLFSYEDIRDRAVKFFRRSVGHGAAKIRTHTDVDRIVGMKSLTAVLDARAIVAEEIDVEVVAFSNARNDLLAPGARNRLIEATHKGVRLIGAVPALSTAPQRSLEAVLDLAAEYNLDVDLHLDEHLDVGAALIEPAIQGVIARGLQGRVAVSHVCVLAAMSSDASRQALDGMARAGMTLVVLPELNLYLQDRGAGAPRRRGLAPVAEALVAGVSVRLGTDNVRDWFYPYGDGDMLDTARIAALALQLGEPSQLLPMLCEGRLAISAGDPADLLLVNATSFDDMLARRPAGRVLIRKGRIVTPPGDIG